MTQVNLHEANSSNNNHAFCFGTIDGQDVLQVQEEILKQLQAERNQDISNYQFYYDEMEKIHENTYESGTHDITTEAAALDVFFGSLGLAAEANYNIINKGRQYDGIC